MYGRNNGWVQLRSRLGFVEFRQLAGLYRNELRIPVASGPPAAYYAPTDDLPNPWRRPMTIEEVVFRYEGERLSDGTPVLVEVPQKTYEQGYKQAQRDMQKALGVTK